MRSPRGVANYCVGYDLIGAASWRSTAPLRRPWKGYPPSTVGNHASARRGLSGFVVNHHERIDVEELGNGAELRLEAGYELVIEKRPGIGFAFPKIDGMAGMLALVVAEILANTFRRRAGRAPAGRT